ncbi:glycosyltransferase, partial [Patescibacteria group bacterium AH-259-L07]|nr:glycosyltransferase [Patescibacteria group bacterium AH-259-L07]
FDDLKNQLRLIQALGGGTVDVVLIGQVNPKFINYYNLCKKEAEKYRNIYFLPVMAQEKLASAYVAAKVCVTPSWFETFSLVSIEAAAAGANVVVTNRSPLKEYFDDLIWYCHPDDKESIKQSVLEAYRHPTKSKLKNLVIKKFNWQEVASRVLTAYESIL